jgi:hypothetical protein
VLGVLLAIGRPSAYCWLVVGVAAAMVTLLLRREFVSSRARPSEAHRRSHRCPSNSEER